MLLCRWERVTEGLHNGIPYPQIAGKGCVPKVGLEPTPGVSRTGF